jgi:hypothetical protein
MLRRIGVGVTIQMSLLTLKSNFNLKLIFILGKDY